MSILNKNKARGLPGAWQGTGLPPRRSCMEHRYGYDRSPAPAVLSVIHAVEYLDVSRDYIYDLISEASLPYVQLRTSARRSKIRSHVSQLDKLLKQRMIRR